jgi:hypothetical protein
MEHPSSGALPGADLWTYDDSDTECGLIGAAQELGRTFAKFKLGEDDASSTSAASSSNYELPSEAHTKGSDDELESQPPTKSDISFMQDEVCSPFLCNMCMLEGCVCRSPALFQKLPAAVAAAFSSADLAEANANNTDSSAAPSVSASSTEKQEPKPKKWQLSAAAVLQDLQKVEKEQLQHTDDMASFLTGSSFGSPSRHRNGAPATPKTAPPDFMPPPGFPHPPDLILAKSHEYSVQSFRRDIFNIMRELKFHKTVGVAVRQVRMCNVPRHRQSAEFADILTLAVEETRGPARRMCIAFVGGLTKAFERSCCVAGLRFFFTEIYATLCSEVYNLKSIVISEIMPILKAVLRAKEMETVIPVLRSAVGYQMG